MFSLAAPDDIAQRLKPLDAKVLSELLTGILLSPEHHAHFARVYTLLHWTLALADGQRTPTRGQIIELFGLMDEHPARMSEDPPEELFTDEVWTDTRSFRIFPGPYLGAAYHLQRLLTSAMCDEAASAEDVRCALLLLVLSDALAERGRFAPGLPGEVSPREPIRPNLQAARHRGEFARFDADDLAALGVSLEDLKPFILADSADLISNMFGDSPLEHRPLVRCGTGIRVLSPSGLGTATRAHLVLALGPAVAEPFYERDWIRWLAVDLPVAKAFPQPATELEITDPRWTTWLNDRAVALTCDADKQAHVIALESRWPANLRARLSPPLGGGAALRAAVLTYAREMRDQLCDADAAGLTIIVQNSPGWALDLGPPVALGPRWFAVPMTAYAFSTLLRTPSFQLLDLWKLHAQLAELEAGGRPVHMHQEALTQWSLWEQLGYTFSPPFDDVREGRFLIDGGTVGPFVARTRAFRALHGVPTPGGELALVERMVDLDGPEGDLAKPLYYHPLEITAGTLTGVVEARAGPWWVTVGRPPSSPEDRQFLYLLWQATLEWLVRADRVAISPIPTRRTALHINLLPVPELISDGPDEPRYFYNSDGGEVRIVLPASLMAQMVRADNVVETLTLTWILEGLLNLAGGDPAQASGWAREILADPNLKMIHVTHEPDAGHAVDLSSARPSPFRPLQRPDLAQAGRWMDERLTSRGTIAAVQPLKVVEDPTQVNDILKGAVDEHWETCRRRLSNLDRRAVIDLVMGLIEGLHRRRVSDERAALARRAAYDEDPSLRARLSQERDQAFRTYRVVAEMALCSCPLSGGRLAGYSDVDVVAADVAALVRLAEHSDAVQRKLLEPAVAFLPNGSITLPRGDASGFMDSYGRACVEESIRLDEDSYADRFLVRAREEAPTTSGEPDPDDDDFESAVAGEFGLSLSTIVALTAVLQNVAVERAEEAPRLRRSKLFALLHSEIDGQQLTITPQVLDRYLGAFALQARSSWETPPNGFTPDDIYPWFFERRLSLMMRPLIILDDTDDPEIQFGVRHLMMGVQYALTLLEEGIWAKGKLRSPEARGYVDRQVDRRGKAFEAEVANIYRRGGWTVESSILMSSVGAGKAYGDIDVLAISPDGATWHLIECKWFGAARTPREVAGWMQDFHGHGGDKLDRHLKRFEWVQSHLDVFARALGTSPPARLEGRIATTNPVPLAFVTNLPNAAQVRTRRQLLEDLNEKRR